MIKSLDVNVSSSSSSPIILRSVVAVNVSIAFISTYFTDNLIIQIVVFTFFTVISLIFTKPLLDKFINKNVTKTNIDMIIGKIGIVTKEINELSPGRVKVSGKDWMAVSNSHIDEGKKVRVLKIEGAKIIVREEER